MLSPEAFHSFYESALPVVYGYFFKRCGGRRDVAHDLTQETFLSAVRALRSGAAVKAPLPWIVAIARRRLVDHYRRQRRGRRLLTTLQGAVQEPQVPQPVTSGEVQLIEALEALPSHYRLALILRYVDDLSVAEVAENLDKSVRATESLLVRARSALTESYRKSEDE